MTRQRTLYLPVRFSWMVHNLPNFHRSGSIAGMRRQFYGRNAILIRCGQYIYNATGSHNLQSILNHAK